MNFRYLIQRPYPQGGMTYNLLIRHKADRSIPGIDGNTPVVSQNKYSVIRYLTGELDITLTQSLLVNIRLI